MNHIRLDEIPEAEKILLLFSDLPVRLQAEFLLIDERLKDAYFHIPRRQ